MDTFDAKPQTPEGIRGEFSPIATSVSGNHISSLPPKLADRYAIVRSVGDEYNGGAHGQSMHLALTRYENPRVNRDDIRPPSDDFPCVGSAAAHLRRACNGLPAHVWLLDMDRRSLVGEGGGFLGQAHDPFRIFPDPNRPDFKVHAITPPQAVRLSRVGALRGLVDDVQQSLDATPANKNLADTKTI